MLLDTVRAKDRGALPANSDDGEEGVSDGLTMICVVGGVFVCTFGSDRLDALGSTSSSMAESERLALFI